MWEFTFDCSSTTMLPSMSEYQLVDAPSTSPQEQADSTVQKMQTLSISLENLIELSTLQMDPQAVGQWGSSVPPWK